ncbi:MAG TPA: PA14 domain-containing protein, partial [Polyangia bacterium]
FCADGVCCDSACTGLCLTCTAAGSVGTCRGVPAGTDPRNDCVQQSADSCGRTGQCSANQTCALYEAGTTCRMTSCVGNQAATSACDGAGICVTTPTQACAPFLCAAAEGCRTTCRSMADCAAPAECFGGVCGGLVGSYYPNKTFSGTGQTRVDATVDFFWYLSEPLPGFPVDAFSVRWTGKVTPRYTETYTFSVISDDGVRLWVDGQLIIDDFRSHGTLETSGTIALVAGKPVSIKLDYFEEGSESIVRLLWSSLSVSKQVIPVTALMP